MSTLDPRKCFEGRSLFLLGGTGFLGKVCLSMLLDRFPGIGRVYLMVRASTEAESDSRFWESIVPSPALDPLRHRYVDGGEMPYDDPAWNVTRPDGSRERVRGPREWRHGLGTVVNGLIARGLEIRLLREEVSDAVDATPGTDAHRETIAPFWLTLWAARWRLGER